MQPLKSNLRPVVLIDREKCVSCHKCIQVCPVKFCNDASRDHISINSDLCIGCGNCIDACNHEARIPVDDFDEFMEALKSGQKIVGIAAPAVAANFPQKYLHLNGWLKSLGVKAIFDVSFGAELTVKSYLEVVKKKNPKCVIAQPCPALVTFMEIYHPELLSSLAPADSPMMHTMRMVREFYADYQNSKFMIISPCLAKRREFDEVGIGDFNVTYRSIDAWLKKNSIDLRSFPSVDYDNPPAERAVLFSTPGGLLRTAQREAPGIELKTRKIEGTSTIYRYLEHLNDSINSGSAPLLVDCLSCEMGCNGGPGTLNRQKSHDEIEQMIEQRNLEAQEHHRSKGLLKSPKRAVARLRTMINKYWKEGLYDRTYVNRSSNVKLVKPTEAQLNEIYLRTKKVKTEDFLNCCSCGYNSCEQMAIAIFNGLNRPENCRHYKEVMLKEAGRNTMEKIDAELSKLVSQVADNIEQSAMNVSNAVSSTEEMSATIRKISGETDKANEIINQASSQAQKISTVLQDLNSAVQEVGNITKTVSEIAKQTDLLALNATIEAAHASQSGKGFAVVANEIKELSGKTASATKQINSTIERVRSSTQGAINEINTIGDTILQVNQSVNEIASAIQEQSSATDVVAKNISEISTQFNQTASNISQVVEVTKSIGSQMS